MTQRKKNLIWRGESRWLLPDFIYSAHSYWTQCWVLSARCQVLPLMGPSSSSCPHGAYVLCGLLKMGWELAPRPSWQVATGGGNPQETIMGRVTGWVVRPSSKQRTKGFLYPSLLWQLQGTWFSFWKLLGAFLFQQWSLGCLKACNTWIMHIWGLMSPARKAFPALSIFCFWH